MPAPITMVLDRLYHLEVNAGIQGFWDAGFSVFIGDSANGWSVVRNFRPGEWGAAGEWLHEEAAERFPAYRKAHGPRRKKRSGPRKG